MFPSEDELLELLRLDIIDFDQYERLLEVSLQGVDSTNQYLLDDIPDLALYVRDLRSLSTLREDMVTTSSAIQPLRPGAGYVRHQYSREGAADGRSRYRTVLHLEPAEGCDAEARLYREYSGRERIARRFVRYKSKSSHLRLFEVGSFSTRFGLGSAFGYRGKLVSYSARPDGESMLFPDYGGANGAHMSLQSGGFAGDLALSVTRDANHRIQTGAVQLLRELGKSRLGLITGQTRVHNRVTGLSFDDVKLGGFGDYIYGEGELAAEITMQAAEKSGPAAALIQGRHRYPTGAVRYALWAYGDDYLDLSGGSKAGAVSREVYLDDVDFEMSTRRSGQEGGQIETAIDLEDDLSLINSVKYSQIDRDSSNFELLSSVETRVSSAVEFRADLFLKRRYLIKPGDDDERIQRQYRAEARLSLGEWRVRTYIAWREHNQRQNYGGLFVNAVYRSDTAGRWQGWLDLRRLNFDTKQLDYAYVYILAEQSMGEKIATAFKIAHRYSRSTGGPHETTITLELRAGI